VVLDVVDCLHISCLNLGEKVILVFIVLYEYSICEIV